MAAFRSPLFLLGLWAGPAAPVQGGYRGLLGYWIGGGAGDAGAASTELRAWRGAYNVWHRSSS